MGNDFCFGNFGKKKCAALGGNYFKPMQKSRSKVDVFVRNFRRPRDFSVTINDADHRNNNVSND